MFVHQQPATFYVFFFFNDTATTEIYTLSLHDALPICPTVRVAGHYRAAPAILPVTTNDLLGPARVYHAYVSAGLEDRKSTRLNSSHSQISYAVFCLKKKRNLITKRSALKSDSSSSSAT